MSNTRILNIFFLNFVEVKSKQAELEKKIRTLENGLALNDNFEQCSSYNLNLLVVNELEAIFGKTAYCVMILSTCCNWYEHGKKVFKRFLKHREAKGRKRSILENYC